MSTQIKYAYRRHNTWAYRRTYPVYLQQVLGSSLKRSLHTADAKVAAKRVAELNTTFDAIVQEAEAQVTNPECSSTPAHIAVAAPRYHRARLLGERLVADLAQDHLALLDCVTRQTRPAGNLSNWHLFTQCPTSYYT